MDLRMKETGKPRLSSFLFVIYICLSFKHLKQVQTLHFHSPMLVSQSCLTLCDAMDCSLPSSSVHRIFQARIMEWVATGSLIQGIFPTQGLNLDLLPCRQILYHLSHYGNPDYKNLYFPSLIYSSHSLYFSGNDTNVYISRQEYWSGLPFRSPMHTSMLRRCSRVWLCVTLQTAAHQPPLTTGFSRQEYWSGLSFPSPIVYSYLPFKTLFRC